MSTPHIAGYRFIAPVRDSSLSVTWKAVQTSLDRVVAIKVLYPAVASDEVQKRHFVDIARTVSRLRHPGFVQVFDVVEDAPQPFVVMEHVEGETLAERVAAQGPLPPALAARVVLCLAEALDHAWGNARLVLRNLKPTEVRFAAPTVPKIVDFGLAIRSIPATDCAALDGGHIVGTPQFIAPEQTRPGAMPDFRADMYALGATLYFLLTGRVPFGEMDPVAILDRQVNGQIPHPRAIDSRLPPAVCSLAVRLMMKNPAHRPASWADVAEDARTILRNRPLRRRPPAGTSTIGPPPDALNRRMRTPANAVPRSAPGSEGIGPLPQILLWILLGLWFTLVFNDRAGNPLGVPFALFPPPAPVPANAVPSESVPVAVPPRPEPPTRPAGVSSAQPVEPGPATAAATPAETPAGTTPGSVLPNALIRELATALSCDNRVAARLAVSGPVAGVPAETLDRLRTALDRLPDLDARVEQAVMARRGETVTINYLDRERTIVPMTVVNGELQAEYVAADGTRRPVNLPLAKLSAAERLRWLPPPENESDHVAVCLLALMAGDRDRLTRYAAACGPLAPVFTAALQ